MRLARSSGLHPCQRQRAADILDGVLVHERRVDQLLELRDRAAVVNILKVEGCRGAFDERRCSLLGLRRAERDELHDDGGLDELVVDSMNSYTSSSELVHLVVSMDGKVCQILGQGPLA